MEKCVCPQWDKFLFFYIVALDNSTGKPRSHSMMVREMGNDLLLPLLAINTIEAATVDILFIVCAMV